MPVRDEIIHVPNVLALPLIVLLIVQCTAQTVQHCLERHATCTCKFWDDQAYIIVEIHIYKSKGRATKLHKATNQTRASSQWCDTTSWQLSQ